MPSSRKKQLDPKRRKRTIITPDQLHSLESAFTESPWPSRSTKDGLARDLGYGIKFIRTWFQNRRAKAKRDETLTGTTIKSKSDEENSQSISIDGDDDKSLSSTDKSDSMDTTGDVLLPDFSAIENTYVDQNPAQQPTESTSTEKKIGKKSSGRITDSSLLKYQEKGQSRRLKLKRKSSSKVSVVQKVGSCEETGPSKPKLRKILPLEKVCPEAIADNSLQDLIRLTKNINNQMNWGTFGMANVRATPGFPRQSTAPSTVTFSGAVDSKPTIEQSVPMSYITACGTARSTSKEPKETKGLSEKVKSEPRVQLSKLLPRPVQSFKPASLFRAAINMIAVAEGGIIPVSHPEFNKSTNDFLYGIRVNGNSRLVYSKANGLDLLDNIPYESIL